MTRIDKDGFISVLTIHRDDVKIRMEDRGIDVSKFSNEDLDELTSTIADDMDGNEYLMEGFWQIIDNHIEDLQ